MRLLALSREAVINRRNRNFLSETPEFYQDYIILIAIESKEDKQIWIFRQEYLVVKKNGLMVIHLYILCSVVK